MGREKMYTPVEPLPAIDTRAYNPDHVAGIVARLDAQVGRRPGTLGPEDDGVGMARDLYDIKKKLGRMPGTHGVDDEGDGIAAHVFNQRSETRRGKRNANVALVGATLAFLAAVTSLVRAEANAIARENRDAARERQAAPASSR